MRVLPVGSCVSCEVHSYLRVVIHQELNCVYACIFDMILQGACRSGKHYSERHLVSVDINIFDHVKGHEVFSKVGFLYISKSLKYFLLRHNVNKRFISGHKIRSLQGIIFINWAAITLVKI